MIFIRNAGRQEKRGKKKEETEGERKKSPFYAAGQRQSCL
jgi:hypothetical protein